MTVDWQFVTGLEACKLEGYVPDAGTSGVTIATGIDLGQRNAHDFESLPDDLQDRLRPYLGLKLDDARKALEDTPLEVSQDEADEIDELTRALILAPLSSHFKAAAGVPFESCPAAAQTVMASVGYQYGAPWVRCPKFWSRCVARDWPGVVRELQNFGDAYPTRRRKEAALLAAAIKAGG